MGTGLRWANELLAFLLELTALVALGYWGFTTGSGVLMSALLGLGVPLVAVLLWGLFAAPRARFQVPLAAVLLVKAVVLGAAVAALFATGHPVPAVIFAVVTAANTAIVTVARHRSPLPVARPASSADH